MFRLLKTGHQPGAMNMAIDEAVLENISAGKSMPTLRFYGWSPATVTIGYFQSLEEELDLDACKKYGVEYVRRVTGGGAVLHEFEITYSIHIPLSAGLLPTGILESYRKISDGILLGLKHLGLEAQFVPLNDIVLNDPASQMLKKISGNAQTRKNGIVLQHGTILLRVDIDKMFNLLKVPSEKMKGKLISDVKQRVTSLSDIAGREVTFSEMEEILTRGFQETFHSEKFEQGELTKPELDRAIALVTEKYNSDRWNRKR